MRDEKLDKLLYEFADATAEPVRSGLGGEIKSRIPEKLTGRRGGLNTVNIIIDLRISKLAAAAAIIITMVLSASFLGSQHTTGESIYADSKLLIKYCLGGENAGRSEILAGLSKFHEYLVHQGKDAYYYGDMLGPQDNNAILMQWKLSEGKYRVIFGDLREKTVSTEELVELQSRMLEVRTK
jgi:hypothetical protein